MDRVQKAQACRFLLARHGLLGAARFRGSEGVMAYVKQVGCVQYDPVDVCGKSHELAFLARVGGFTREMLSELLYDKRVLMDYFDKNMSIMQTADWPYMAFVREGYCSHTRGSELVEPVIPRVLEAVHARGSLSAQELDMKQKADWYWSETSLARATLETLYFRGELVVHHKTGAIKSYALARDCLPETLLNAPCPFESELERQAWQVYRRIGAVGLLWNAASDAWLGVNGLKARQRDAAFALLAEAGDIRPVSVEGVARPLYMLSRDAELLHACETAFSTEKHCRLLPPLDCMLWDRRLIAELFGFAYKWEIYTPESRRRYGYYVLPVVYGERFAGRVEPMCDRREGVLNVNRFWPEDGFRVTNRFLWELEDALKKLCAFHGLERVCWRDGWLQDGRPM